MPKISQYPSMGPITGPELLLGDQGGVTSTGTPNQLLTFIRGLLTSKDTSATISATDSGVVNAYVVAHAQPVAALSAGLLAIFTPLNTNTGPSTVNVDGTGVKAIVRGTGAALTGGELSSLGPVILVYNGVSWQIAATAGAQPGFERQPAEIAAGVNPAPANYVYGTQPYDVRRYGAKGDGVTDDTAAINTALLVASQTINMAQGSAIYVPLGTFMVSSMIFLPNRVRVLGVNKRGSYIKATAGWAVGNGSAPWNNGLNYVAGNLVTQGGVLYIAKKASGPGAGGAQMPPNVAFWTAISNAMFYAQNGYTAGVGNSMFDSTVENIALDASNVAGLGCILSSAWQDDCGPRSVLLINFATYGLQLQDAFGGADLLKVIDTEIFGGTTANATGIAVVQMSLSGAVFMLDVQDTGITGAGVPLLYGIQMQAENLHVRATHVEVSTHAAYIAGAGTHTIEGFTGAAATVTNLVTVDANFSGMIKGQGTERNGSTNLINDLRVGQIAQLGAITGGAGYGNGTYTNVPLTGGTGTTATATIVVAGGAVTSASITQPGTGYVVGDVLSANNANLGGSGAGFSVPVFDTFTGLGAVAGKDYVTFKIVPKFNAFGLSTERSPFAIVAQGVANGTLVGTNAVPNSQNVLSFQRTGVGRYTVTIANSLGSVLALNPQANCPHSTHALSVNIQSLGANSFAITIDDPVANAPADSAEVHFWVTEA